jgi:hypothetical protein
MDDAHDFYELLGITADASASEIKAAFKHLALKYHPDVYSGPDAEERMRLLLEAYKTLTDARKRRTYDLAHGIRRSRSEAARPTEAEEPFAFYRSPDGRGFTTQASGPLPAQPPAGSAAPQGSAASPKKEAAAPSRVTPAKIAVTFPRLEASTGAVITLENFVYTLTMQQAASLREGGRLLGADLPQKIAGSTGGGRRGSCHRCGHNWIIPPEQRRSSTERCPKCTAPDWSEYLLLRCQHCTAVFESQQIRRYDRVKIGERYYGDFHLCSPYELFPLCPNCQVGQWCAGEEMRLTGRTGTGKQRASGPLPQATSPRHSVAGSFPRAGVTGTTGAYARVRPSSPIRQGQPPRILLTLVIGLLIVGVLFAVIALTVAAR